MKAALLLLAAQGELAIDVNQVGFAPDAPKLAIARTPDAAPRDWRIEDAAGKTMLSGKTTPLPADPRAGGHQQAIDLSALTDPGKGYRIRIGEAASAAFSVAPQPYRVLASDALAFFYHQRAGTPILARHAGGAQWARPAAHVGERVTCFAGKDQRGNVWPGCEHTLDVTGGWYDAGDHGKYVVNGGIATWTLLNLHEWTGGAAFPDGAQSMPEAGNRVSDLLDEARYEVGFLLAMQVPRGKTMQLPVGQNDPAKPLTFTAVDAGGMAHHKVADERWTSIPMRPDRDPVTRRLYPPSTAATLNLAAVAAQAARIWRTIDPAFAKKCLDAATAAWAAAQRNPQLFAVGDFTGSGGYGDRDVSDESFWAAAELYATTGDPRFAAAVDASPHAGRLGGEPSWASVAALGHATLAIGSDWQRRDRSRALIVEAADRFERERRDVAYRIPFASERYVWGSTSNLLSRAMLLRMAQRWAGEARFGAAAGDALDYILGRNPMGTSYVSGHGERALQNPHHRFWARQADPAYPGPPPGALSGGPNNSNMGDPVAEKLKGKCAPQRCWVDDIGAFTMNEVAINWNAPLVWVATTAP
ncbi:glycoside hydrolase family 9 protein [Sphingomonas qomolangmaensis]|uniref:Endoglucanase n=1 Tax=Sphingomonas qomolangmaensis TaxID=2918765 RepID=A0ABY5L2Q2_9SPHN|nr:glycoside hydrolase family 9 protein [Sphingomonas qomolangmaensis]UUL81215.1 glycoside hydrolase family 9 protein [Sphingomonas qomolangmaensis]